MLHDFQAALEFLYCNHSIPSSRLKFTATILTAVT